MIIGVDLGYGYTKTSEGIIFQSRITENRPIIGNYPEVKIDHKTCYVGCGNSTIEVNKINNDITKVLLFTSLALSSQIDNFKVITGLTIAQYESKQREMLKNMIQSNNKKTITFNGKERLINITDVDIFPQSAASLFVSDIKDDAIIVDIGTSTTDISYFVNMDGKRKLTKYSTLFHGMLVLYTDIINRLNQDFDLALKYGDGYKILKNGLFINGSKQDIGCLKSVIMNFAEEIFEELMLNYPYKTTAIWITGGGAETLFPIFKIKFPNTYTISDSQFSNAKGMKKVGVLRWQ